MPDRPCAYRLAYQLAHQLACPLACARIALVAAAALGPMPALAQTPSTPAPVTELDAVTSSANRYERSLKDVPGSVTVIDEEEVAKRNAGSIRDLTRYEPGVSVSNSPLRSGIGNYTIRGIGGNRVAVTIDGLRLPDFPENSQPGTYFRNYVDLENLKRVEIVRGPASTLFGSDAIGGLVAYFTKDPEDYLREVGKDWYVSGRVRLDSADDSVSETATMAGRAGAFETLALVTRRDGQELENNGSRQANPQDTGLTSFLGKTVWKPTESDRFRLTAEYADLDVRTDVRSSLTSTILGQRADDNSKRRRVSLDHVHNAPIGFVDNIRWLVGYQEVDRREHTDEDRISAGQRRLRVTDQNFSQDILSGDLQLESRAELLGLSQRLVYGIDFSLTDTTRPRDRTEINLVTGAATKTIAGESFPTKTFPDSRTLLAGAYIQDEVTLLGGRLSLTGGLRVDYYDLSVDPDADFLRNNPDPVSGQSATGVSPKLGAVYRLDGTFSLFGQYAHGFRAPPYDDANIGFTNNAFGYRVLPNPNLKPETSDGVEAGLRGTWRDGSSFQIGGFYTYYQSFIEQIGLGVGPTGLLDFQARNLDEVVIWGFEGKGRWQLLPEWALLGSIAYARGEDQSTGLPIDSVDPLKGVVGLRYERDDGWGGELVATGVVRQDRVSDPTFFKTPGYGVLDLLAFYDLDRRLSVALGIFNIFDQRYFIHQDVVGLANSSPLKELYTQPGRTVALNVTVRW